MFSVIVTGVEILGYCFIVAGASRFARGTLAGNDVSKVEL